jgi:hypothetical protein
MHIGRHTDMETNTLGLENAWPDFPVYRGDVLTALPRTSLQGGLDPLIRRVAFALYKDRQTRSRDSVGWLAPKDQALDDWLLAQSLVELMLDEMGHNL